MKSVFLFIGLWTLMVSCAIAQAEGSWTHLMDQDGIAVYERANDSSGGIEYKVTANLAAPAATVIRFLSDFANYQKFISFFSHTEMLKQVSEHDFYGYAVMAPGSTPEPTDLVLHAQFRNLPNGNWIGRASAVAGFYPEQPGLKRNTSLEALWAIQGTGTTTCRYTYHYFVAREAVAPAYVSELARINIENIVHLRQVAEHL